MLKKGVWARTEHMTEAFEPDLASSSLGAKREDPSDIPSDHQRTSSLLFASKASPQPLPTQPLTYVMTSIRMSIPSLVDPGTSFLTLRHPPFPFPALSSAVASFSSFSLPNPLNQLWTPSRDSSLLTLVRLLASHTFSSSASFNR
jgi:hypothetical protein